MIYKLHLASQSPRRRDLLESEGYKFSVDSVKVSEIINENLNPPQVVQDLAEKKARALVEARKDLKLKGNLVLGADTLVCYQGKLLGKPESLSEAAHFLDLMSGEWHQVLTGICLIEPDADTTVVDYDETLVQFRKLSAKDIQDYLDTGEPMGKAGAYAIQGEGSKLVESFKGSWSNVVGLPLEKLKSVLEKNNWVIDGRQNPKN